jgi:predicted acylesterase/phospholipase RssA
MTPGCRVSLVLGSGGARGYAHIGAIQILRERGYEIVAVAGSSMGRWSAASSPRAGSTSSPSGRTV